MPPKSKGAGDKNLKSKSPAEFFQDNKGIAGFENAGKSLYTTLREFIENSLDSAESIGVLPDVDIMVEEVTLSQYEDLIGLKAHVRKDSALYADIETDKEKQKRLKEEAKAGQRRRRAGRATREGREEGRCQIVLPHHRQGQRQGDGARRHPEHARSACCRVPSTV